MIKLDAVTKAFGGVRACNGVSHSFAPTGITSIIGPNGAGKTTLLHLVAGYHALDQGRIFLGEREISRWEPSRRARAGVIRTFQFEAGVPGMTVLDNVLLGLSCQFRSNLLSGMLRTPAMRREEQHLREKAVAALEQVGLAVFADALPGRLTYGMTKLLAVARAAVAQPQVLLLDEPAAGLNNVELEALVKLLRKLAQSTAIVLVEHNFRFVTAVADQVLVMHHGSLVFTGDPESALSNGMVRDIFTGREHHAVVS